MNCRLRQFRRRSRICLLLALGMGLAPLHPPASAQQTDPLLRLDVVEPRVAPRVTLGPVLTNEGVRSSLESGLPVRIKVVTELWRDRTFDALEGRHEWRATIRLDPLTARYLLETSQGEGAEAASPAAARGFLQNRLVPSVAPARSGRFYYIAKIEIETLSLSDLDELRRWLRGDTGAAVGGQEEVGSLLGRGLRRLLVRALGLPVQRYETRTPGFLVTDAAG